MLVDNLVEPKPQALLCCMLFQFGGLSYLVEGLAFYFFTQCRVPACFLVLRIYKGWLPTVLKVSTAQATRFGVFQVVKSSPSYGQDTPIKAAAAGAFAGATSVLLFQVSQAQRMVP